jgi:hypothetical protein
VSRLLRVLSVAYLLLAGPAAAAAEVQGSLERATIGEGESTTLTISVSGEGSVSGEPSFRTPEGLRIRDSGTSRSYSLINGRFSQSLEFRYVIIGQRVGRYEIGPVEVTISNQKQVVGPFTLEVVKGQPPPSRVPPRDSPDGQRSTPSPFYVEMVASPETAYVGQQVTLRTRFWSRADVAILDARFIPPETEGFWREELPPERRSQDVRGGTLYEITEVVSGLFPTRAGELTITPARVAVRYRESRRRRRDPFSFFGFGGVERDAEPSAQPVTVKVLPLPVPAAGGFTGAVGQFRITSETDQMNAVQGEPITWTVTITGYGNLAAVEGPTFPEIAGCRGFDSGTEVARARKDDLLGGKKSFSHVLIPESAGILELPSLVWAYFDPKTRQYRTSTVEARRIDVAPAAADGGLSSGRVGSAIRGIRQGSDLSPLRAELPWRQTSFWLWQLVPLAALAAGYAHKRGRERSQKDPAGTRFRRAPRRLRKALRALEEESADPWGSLARAVESFLSDRYGTEIHGMTREALTGYLVSCGNDEDVAAQIVEVLQDADSRRFTPAKERDQQDVLHLAQRIVELAPRLEKGRRRA